MESFYHFSDELAPEFEPMEELTSNYEAMVEALISLTPDPRLYVKE